MVPKNDIKQKKKISLPPIFFSGGHTEGLGFFPKNLVSRYRPFFARYFFISFQNHCHSQNRGSVKSIFQFFPDLGTFFWWSEVVRLDFLKVLEVLSQNRDFRDFGTIWPCFAFLKFWHPKWPRFWKNDPPTPKIEKSIYLAQYCSDDSKWGVKKHQGQISDNLQLTRALYLFLRNS